MGINLIKFNLHNQIIPISLIELKRINNPFSRKMYSIRSPEEYFQLESTLQPTQTYSELKADWDFRDHLSRVKYFIQKGWDQPIEIDVGVPALNHDIKWKIIDGNHRYFASLIRKDVTIAATLSGQVDYMLYLFPSLKKLI